jgi:hypothetical protein
MLTTKQARSIVRSTTTVLTSWTNESKQASNLRNLCFIINNDATVIKQIKTLLILAGHANKIHVTSSWNKKCYLRVLHTQLV